jgi:PD-(D/E)XK nuclease superfamily protein
VRELTPTEKGAIAEAKIYAAAVEAGIVVARPFTEGRRYDLIFDVGPKLLRVQCKTSPRQGDVIVLRAVTSQYTPSGHVRTRYAASEVDGIAAYCPELDACFYVPIEDLEGKAVAHFRLAPARNGQRAGVTMTAQYRLGAVAQLGERSAGSRKVVGSIPISSTPSPGADIVVGAHAFRERFGYWMQLAAGTDVVVTRHGTTRVRLTQAGPLTGNAA